MLTRKQYKVRIENEEHRITNETTDYFLFGMRIFRDQHEVAQRGAEIPQYIRDCVRKMDGEECVYCSWVNRESYFAIISRNTNGQATPRKFSIDHIIPQVQGGGSWIWNLAYCCSSCNSRKQGRTPTEADMPLNHGPFHKTALGLFIPYPSHLYERAYSYMEYVSTYGYGEPFNTEFIKIRGVIPYVDYTYQHQKPLVW
jgi:hypothetical protein